MAEERESGESMTDSLHPVDSRGTFAYGGCLSIPSIRRSRQWAYPTATLGETDIKLIKIENFNWY